MSDLPETNHVDFDYFEKNNVNRNEKFHPGFALDVQEQGFDFPSMATTKIFKKMVNFHNNLKKGIMKCKIYQKACPNNKIKAEYICAQCTQGRKMPKKFSTENNVISKSVINILKKP